MADSQERYQRRYLVVCEPRIIRVKPSNNPGERNTEKAAWEFYHEQCSRLTEAASELADSMGGQEHAAARELRKKIPVICVDCSYKSGREYRHLEPHCAGAMLPPEIRYEGEQK